MKEPYITITYLSLLAVTGIGISVYKNRQHMPLLRKLAVGHLLVNIPAFALAFAIPALLYVLFDALWLKLLFIVPGFAAGLLLAWINWSLMIPKWRKWAFKGLDDGDLIQLEKLAVDQRLIWQQGHIFEQTELRSRKDQELLINIEERISFLKELEDIKLDLSLGNELAFTFKKTHLWLELISKIFLLVIVAGCLATNSIAIGIALLAAILFVGDNKNLWKNIRAKKPALILNQAGIKLQTQKNHNYNWGEVVWISVDSENDELILKLVDVKKPITFELSLFNIPDYEQLIRATQIFVDRYVARREELAGQLN